VTETDTGTITDQSDAPFQIANGGTEYYVNIADDVDFGDNEYTTAAGDKMHQ